MNAHVLPVGEQYFLSIEFIRACLNQERRQGAGWGHVPIVD